jgi:ParB-like chromosome segregation protein Spo0J
MLLPEMRSDEFADLRKSIAAIGLTQPIALYDGMILDGRHRYRACLDEGVQPEFVTLPPNTDPAEYAIAQNLHRRHLPDKGQRAAIAVQLMEHFSIEALARQRRGIGADGSGGRGNRRANNLPEAVPEGLDSRDRAGKVVGVSGRLVGTAARLKEAAPEQFEEVFQGKKKLADAVREAGLMTRRAKPGSTKPSPISACGGMGDAVMTEAQTPAEHSEGTHPAPASTRAEPADEVAFREGVKAVLCSIKDAGSSVLDSNSLANLSNEADKLTQDVPLVGKERAVALTRFLKLISPGFQGMASLEPVRKLSIEWKGQRGKVSRRE